MAQTTVAITESYVARRDFNAVSDERAQSALAWIASVRIGSVDHDAVRSARYVPRSDLHQSAWQAA
jgi:hypothetical protein